MSEIRTIIQGLVDCGVCIDGPGNTALKELDALEADRRRLERVMRIYDLDRYMIDNPGDCLDDLDDMGTQ